MLYREQTFAPRAFHSAPATNKHSQDTEKARLEPAIRDAQKLAQNVFPPWKLNRPCWISVAYSDSHRNHHITCKLDFLQKSSLEWKYFPPFRFRYNATSSPGRFSLALGAPKLTPKPGKSALGTRLRVEAARTTHPPPRTPAPHSPFCDVFYCIWRILRKIKSIHIAGRCPGHPFLNFWIRSWFYLVFFVCQSLLAIRRQWNRENVAILSVKPRSDV